MGKTQVSYLRYIVSAQGVAADLAKVQALIDWLSPANLKELQGFLGLTGYYRKFVAGYAITLPLTEQLKKDCFWSNNEVEKAFNELKKAMISIPVLALPNFTKEFIVKTDAFEFGLGIVLLQDERPVAFFSQTLGPQARLKPIYEKELMTIVYAVIRW